MDALRRQWSNGKVSLQTPVVTLAHRGDQRTITLVLTAHLGEARYYERLNEMLAVKEHVFFEGVRAASDDPEHARDAQHRFLRELREVYAGLASLGRLSFQGAALAPQPEWTNADVTCCELAEELRRRGVSMWRQETAMKILKQVVERGRNGDEFAARSITLALQCGLLAVSMSGVFTLLSWLPTTRGLYTVLNDWRSNRAARCVLESGATEATLIYGAAHADSIMSELRRAGFRETGREWHTVFTL